MLKIMRGNAARNRNDIFEISCFVGNDPTPRHAYALAASSEAVAEAIRNTGEDPDDYDIRRVTYWPKGRTINRVRNGHFVEEEEE